MVRNFNVFGKANLYFFSKKILKYGSERGNFIVLQALDDRIVEGLNSLYPLLKDIVLYDLSGNETIEEDDLPLFKIECPPYLAEVKIKRSFIMRIVSQKKSEGGHYFPDSIILELNLYLQNRSKEKLQRLLKYIETELPRYTSHV
jgi:hypothetical protein